MKKKFLKYLLQYLFETFFQSIQKNSFLLTQKLLVLETTKNWYNYWKIEKLVVPIFFFRKRAEVIIERKYKKADYVGTASLCLEMQQPWKGTC